MPCATLSELPRALRMMATMMARPAKLSVRLRHDIAAGLNEAAAVIEAEVTNAKIASANEVDKMPNLPVLVDGNVGDK